MKTSINKTRLAIIAMCFLSLPVFFSCSNDDPDHYEVSADKSELIFKNEVNSQVLNITSKGEWHIDADGLEKGYGTNTGTADWYIIDNVYGSGNSTIKIDLKNSQAAQGSKTATLKLIGKYNRLNIVLKQETGAE